MRRSKWFKGSVTLPILLVVPAAILFVAATILTVYAFTNPSQTPPGGTAGPIAVTMGGTSATTSAQALLNLGAAASGANSNITSLSPTGNLTLTPTGYVGVGTASPGLELGVNGGVLANEGLPSCTPTNAGYSFNGDGCYDTGIFSSGDGDLRLYNNQVLTLHATQSGVIIPTGLAIGTTTIPASGIEFPDGTVQTTAAGGAPASGTQTYSTPGAYIFTVPTNVYYLVAYILGGGGGGGGTAASTACESSNGSGGGGAIIQASVTPGQTISVVVGAGGAGGASGNYAGAVGGSSSIFGFTAYGGNGGIAYAGSCPVSGPAGGGTATPSNASSYYYNLYTGGAGGAGRYPQTAADTYSGSGAFPLGGAGTYGGTCPGQTGPNPGSGGSYGWDGPCAGGNGANGEVQLFW
ncbi:MAG: hypothetical protein KGL39_19515 [Patescibacteria group bacterium]|nr:hypothetical protein [Patescibacteria group bacterium]